MATDRTKWPAHWSRPGFAPLNTRPSNPSSGAYYKVLFPSPAGNGRRITANQNSTGKAFFAVPWDDRFRFELDALGFSEYVAGQKYLKRRLPLRHGDPADATLFLDSLEIVSFHNFDRTTQEKLVTGDGEYSKGWCKTQMCAYVGTFSQVSHAMLEDSAVSSAATPELKRYVTRESETNAYHRKVPGWGVAFDGALTTKCNVLASLPEYTMRLIYTTYRWPVNAVPEHVIAETLGCVNSAIFDPDVVLKTSAGSTLNGYPVEQVLYEDFRKSKPYHGSDGQNDSLLYVDCTHIFLWMPKLGEQNRNWNMQVKPDVANDASGDPTYGYVQFVKADNTAFSPVKRPYPLKDFSKLFKPAGATS
jgi:hypothetical protein